MFLSFPIFLLLNIIFDLITVRRADSCKMHLLIRERYCDCNQSGRRVVFYLEPVAMSTTSSVLKRVVVVFSNVNQSSMK